MARKSSRQTKISSGQTRVTTACSECRHRKIKCWPGDPCKPCLEHERECVRARAFRKTQSLIETSSATETDSKSASSHIPPDSTSSCVGEPVSHEPLHENSMDGDNSLRSILPTPKAVNFVQENREDRDVDASTDSQRVYILGSIMFHTCASLEQGITVVPIEAYVAGSDMHPSGQATFKLTDKTAIDLARMHKYIYLQQSLLYGGEWYSEFRQQELNHLNNQFATALKNFDYNINHETLGGQGHNVSADTSSHVESLISAMFYSQYALRFGSWGSLLSDFI